MIADSSFLRQGDQYQIAPNILSNFQILRKDKVTATTQYAVRDETTTANQDGDAASGVGNDGDARDQ